MNSDNPALHQFLKTWVAEFSRAIETFTGQPRSLGISMCDSVSIPQSAPALWIRQVVSGGIDFEIWIGAHDPTWQELGRSPGDGPPDNLRSTYLEIINQAQQGAATVTSLGLPTPIRCGNLETLAASKVDPASFFVCDLEFIDSEYPSIVIAIEKSALKVLDSAPIPPKQEGKPAVLDSKKVQSTDFHRVADLSLPVSISVGSTKLEINKVLGAGPGSVIALQKESSDLVDLLVDGVIVARGELVVLKRNYGFRVRQIVTKSQRISLYSN